MKKPLILVVSKPRCGSSVMMDILLSLKFKAGPIRHGILHEGLRRMRNEITHPIYIVGQTKPNDEMISLIENNEIEILKLCYNIDDWLKFLNDRFELKLIVLKRNEENRIKSTEHDIDETEIIQYPENFNDYNHIEFEFEKLIEKDQDLIDNLFNFLNIKDDDKKKFINYIIDPTVVLNK